MSFFVFTFILVTITFDPKKRRVILQERGIDFAVDADTVFAGRTVTFVDDRFNYGEVRQITIGWLSARMIVVVRTQRHADRHIISMRYCHAKEEAEFLKRFDSTWSVD